MKKKIAAFVSLVVSLAAAIAQPEVAAVVGPTVVKYATILGPIILAVTPALHKTDE